jgi:hypothetical protein
MGAEGPVVSAGDRADSQTRFAYFYLMKADPDAVRVVAPRHASYWRELRLSHYVGGPFEDRTGGLITFGAADATEAERAVAVTLPPPGARRSALDQGGRANPPSVRRQSPRAATTAGTAPQAD